MMPDGVYEHFADLAASQGYAACSNCGQWLHISQLYENNNGETRCLPCVVTAWVTSLTAYEETALASDDPQGSCAAHHRGAIGAYRRAIEIIKEVQSWPSVFDVHKNREHPQGHTGECLWAMGDSDYGLWFGSCGAQWEFTEDGPAENEMNFCPRCGRKLFIVPLGENT